MEPHFHLSVCAYRTPVSLCDHEVASWMWDHLRDAFPQAVNALLMPNLFLHLAHCVGWRDTSLLAAACHITPQSVRRHLREPPNQAHLSAAALCLGDPRLRISKTHILSRQTFLKATKKAG